MLFGTGIAIFDCKFSQGEVARVKRFYYIGIKGGKSCEGICRSESIDSARQKLSEEGMEEINLAILRSDTVDFLDLETPSEESTSR
jgi:hypothetical protein